MKKLFICLTFLIFAFSIPQNSFGQSNAYVNKSIVGQIGIGYGLGGAYGDMVVPPVVASVDYNTYMAPNIPLSFGGLVGYAESEEKFTFGSDTWTFTYTYMLIGFRAAYHFTQFIKVQNLDTYAGLILGYANVSSEITGPSGASLVTAEGSYLILGVYAGARYYFAQNLGAFLEIGFGMTTASVGLCYKF